MVVKTSTDNDQLHYIWGEHPIDSSKELHAFHTSYVDMIILFKLQLHKLFMLLILFIWNYFNLVAVLNLIKQQMMVSILREDGHAWTLCCISKLSKIWEVITILTQWRTNNFRQADNFSHLRWKKYCLEEWLWLMKWDARLTF